MTDQEEITSHNKQHTQNDVHEEYEELGAAAKELMKPENIIGTFNSTEEMMKNLWDED